MDRTVVITGLETRLDGSIILRGDVHVPHGMVIEIRDGKLDVRVECDTPDGYINDGRE